MLQQLIQWCSRIIKQGIQWLEQTLRQATKPNTTRVVTGAAVDVLRSKAELIAENALLRQQLVVLQRSVKRPLWGSLNVSAPDFPRKTGIIASSESSRCSPGKG